MDTIETLLLISLLIALVTGMQWLDRRYDLGLNMDADCDLDFGQRKAAAAQAEIDRLRARIEELEAVVAEPEFSLAREFAKL